MRSEKGSADPTSTALPPSASARRAFLAVARPLQHGTERQHVEAAAQRVVDAAGDRIDAERARELPHERGDRLAVSAETLVEPANDAVRIGAPQCESGAVLARGHQEGRMDRAGAPSFVDREGEHHAACLAHPQDPVDERAVEVGCDRGMAAVGQHEVDADDSRAGLRGGRKEAAEMPVHSVIGSGNAATVASSMPTTTMPSGDARAVPSRRNAKPASAHRRCSGAARSRPPIAMPTATATARPARARRASTAGSPVFTPTPVRETSHRTRAPARGDR